MYISNVGLKLSTVSTSRHMLMYIITNRCSNRYKWKWTVFTTYLI